MNTTDPATEISLVDIVAVLGRRWMFIAAGCAVALIAGALFAFLSTPLYSASVTVQPASGNEGEGLLSQLSSRLGPAAALIGANIGGGASKRNEYIGVLHSRQLGVRFAKERELLPYLFPDRWDAQSRQWVAEESVLGSILLSGNAQGAGSLAPTDSEVFRELEKIRRIDEDEETGLIAVSFDMTEPELAAQSADAYVALANRVIRDTSVREASRALEYLNTKIAETDIADLRFKMFDLVEAQLETVTLASAREDYAFRVVDPAIVPDRQAFPRRGLILLLSLAVGAIIGSLIALLRDFHAPRGAPHRLA